MSKFGRDHLGNIPVKLFQNPSTSKAAAVFKVFFLLFLVLVAILFNRAKRFEQLHGPSMFAVKAKIMECSINSPSLSLLMKHLVIG